MMEEWMWIIEILAWVQVVLGIFGLGAWFTRWYDDRRQRPR